MIPLMISRSRSQAKYKSAIDICPQSNAQLPSRGPFIALTDHWIHHTENVTSNATKNVSYVDGLQL
jgi:hypothetical protein